MGTASDADMARNDITPAACDCSRHMRCYLTCQHTLPARQEDRVFGAKCISVLLLPDVQAKRKCFSRIADTVGNM